jgi:hypothetical protein
MWHTENTVEYGEVGLETWSLSQCLPERTTYIFNTILLALIKAKAVPLHATKALWGRGLILGLGTRWG